MSVSSVQNHLRNEPSLDRDNFYFALMCKYLLKEFYGHYIIKCARPPTTSSSPNTLISTGNFTGYSRKQICLILMILRILANFNPFWDYVQVPVGAPWEIIYKIPVGTPDI